jgi:hypothetical protein
MALRQALQDYLRGRYFTVVHLEGSNPADFGYISAFKDLNGDGKEEAIVYLTGPDWWQSTVVLTPHGSSYRVMSHAALNPPIRVLPATSTDGWKKLSGRSPRGGGDMTLYETSFSFDGKRYTEDEKGKSPDRTPDSLGELAMERLDASQQGEPLFPKR